MACASALSTNEVAVSDAGDIKGTGEILEDCGICGLSRIWKLLYQDSIALMCAPRIITMLTS